MTAPMPSATASPQEGLLAWVLRDGNHMLVSTSNLPVREQRGQRLVMHFPLSNQLWNMTWMSKFS